MFGCSRYIGYTFFFSAVIIVLLLLFVVVVAVVATADSSIQILHKQKPNHSKWNEASKRQEERGGERLGRIQLYVIYGDAIIIANSKIEKDVI